MPYQNQLLRALPLAVFDRLKPRLRHVSFAPGDTLFAAGGKVANLVFPVGGAISLVTELSGGQMIESAMLGRDSVVGAGATLDDGDAMYKAIVQVAGDGYSIGIDFARQTANESEEFRMVLFRHEQMILVQAQQSAACNATHNLQERLARWLLRVRDVTGGDRFELTQEFMAEMLGVGRTSVSVVAHQLQQAGMISYRRGHISIDNLDALQDCACECYRAVKTQYGRMVQMPESQQS